MSENAQNLMVYHHFLRIFCHVVIGELFILRCRNAKGSDRVFQSLVGRGRRC